MKRSRTKKIFLFNSFVTEVCFINQFINLQSKASVVEDLKNPQDDSAAMQFVEKKTTKEVHLPDACNCCMVRHCSSKFRNIESIKILIIWISRNMQN